MRRPKKRLRDGRTIPFAIIEHDYWDEGHVARMSNAEWKVFTTLIRYADGDDRAMPSVAELETVTGLSRKGVRNSIQGLRRNGYVNQEKPVRHGDSSVYVIKPLKSWSLPAGGLLNTPVVGNSVSHDDMAGGQLNIPGMGDSVPLSGELDTPHVGNSVPHVISKSIESKESAADAAAEVVGLQKEGIELSVIAELKKLRGCEFGQAVRDAIASCNILERAKRLSGKRSGYIISFIRESWKPEPKPEVLPSAQDRQRAAEMEASGERAKRTQVRESLDAQRDREILDLTAIPGERLPKLRKAALEKMDDYNRRRLADADPISNVTLRVAMLKLWKEEGSCPT